MKTAIIVFLYFVKFGCGIPNHPTTLTPDKALQNRIYLVYSELHNRICDNLISKALAETAFKAFAVNYQSNVNVNELLEIIEADTDTDDDDEYLFLKLSNLKQNIVSLETFEYLIGMGEFFLEKIYTIPSFDKYDLYCIALMRLTEYNNAVGLLNLDPKNEYKELVRIVKNYLTGSQMSQNLELDGFLSSIYRKLVCMGPILLNIIINMLTNRLNELNVTMSNSNNFCMNDGSQFVTREFCNYIYQYFSGFCIHFKHQQIHLVMSRILGSIPLFKNVSNNEFIGMVDLFSVSPNNIEDMIKWKNTIAEGDFFVNIAIMDISSVSIETYSILEKSFELYSNTINYSQRKINLEEFLMLIFDKPTYYILLKSLINRVINLCIYKRWNLYIISMDFCTMLAKQAYNTYRDKYNEIIEFIRLKGFCIFISRNIDYPNDQIAKLLINVISTYYKILLTISNVEFICAFQLKYEMPQLNELEQIEEFMSSTQNDQIRSLGDYTYNTINNDIYLILNNLLESGIAKDGNPMVRSRLGLAFSAATMIAQSSGMFDKLLKGLSDIVKFNFLEPTDFFSMKLDNNLNIDLLDKLPEKYSALLKLINETGSVYSINKQRFLFMIITLAEKIFPKHDLSIDDELTQVLKNKEIVISGYKENWEYWGDYTINPPKGFFVHMTSIIINIISIRYFNETNKINIKRIYSTNPIELLLNDRNVHMTDIYFTFNLKMLINNLEPAFLPISSKNTYLIFKSSMGTFNRVFEHLADNTILKNNKIIISLVGDDLKYVINLFPNNVKYYKMPLTKRIDIITKYFKEIISNRIVGLITYRLPPKSILSECGLEQYSFPELKNKTPLFRTPEIKANGVT